jgi:TP901 family phage tail tape measure protein
VAEKTVSVRLKLIHDQYMKAAAESGKATDNIAKADKWKQLGKETSALGDKLSRNVTLPIVGVGVAALKMSGDFDKAFVNMQTLAGVSAKEVDGLKESVLGLSGEVGIAPQELAEALYFIQSSGFAGKEALDALEMSAKGAAAGLGSTIQVADAVTSAINGYGKANLTAARATDILVATAQQGKAEASELAPQFGRLIPIAAELGISFDQVGAGMAFLTRASGDASLASTQMSGILAKLLDSGVEGAKALDAIGGSAESLKQSVREKGLLQTLIDLRAELEANGLSLSDFSRDQQFLQGALQLTGSSAEEAKEIFKAMATETGQTEEAFSKWADSMGAENAQAWAKFQVAMIRLGDTLAPLAADLIGFASGLLEWFQKLPGPVKSIAAALVIMAAAAGPVLSIGGRIITIYGAVSKALAGGVGGVNAFGTAMNQTGTAATGLSTKLGALARVGANLGIFAGAVLAMDAALDALFPVKETNLSKLENDLVKFSSSGKIAGEAAALLGDDFDNLREATATIFDSSNMEDLNHAVSWAGSLGGALGEASGPLEDSKRLFDDLDKTLTSLAAKDPDVAAELFKRISEEMKDAGASTDDVTGAFDDYGAALAEADTANRLTTDAVGEGADAFDAQKVAAEAAVEALKAYSDTLSAQFDPIFGMVDALQANRDAQQGVIDAQHNLNEVNKDGESTANDVREAEEELTAAYLDVGKTAVDVMGATADLNAAVAENPGLVDEAKDALERMRDSGLITGEQLTVLMGQIDATALRAVALGKTDPNVAISISGVGQAFFDIASIQDRINRLRGRDVGIRIVGTAVGVVLPGGAKFMAEGGAVQRGEGYVVGEKGPEWFVPSQNGTIVPNHTLSNMVPQSSFMGGGGGGNTFVSVSMAGAIIASQSDADRWVATAWNRAAASNLVTVRGRPL